MYLKDCIEAWSIENSLFINLRMFSFIVDSFPYSFVPSPSPDLVCIWSSLQNCSSVNKCINYYNSCNLRVFHTQCCGPSAQAISQWGRGKTHNTSKARHHKASFETYMHFQTKKGNVKRSDAFKKMSTLTLTDNTWNWFEPIMNGI